MRLPPGESFYEVLGVPRTATQEQIRFAYRSLAARYHPDKHQGNPLQELAAEKLARINEAYDALSEPERRAAYDAALGSSASPTPRGAPRVVRQRLSLGTVVIATVLALVLFRPLLRLLARLLGAASGTPLGLVLFAALLAGAFGWWRKHKRR